MGQPRGRVYKIDLIWDCIGANVLPVALFLHSTADMQGQLGSASETRQWQHCPGSTSLTSHCATAKLQPLAISHLPGQRVHTRALVGMTVLGPSMQGSGFEMDSQHCETYFLSLVGLAMVHTSAGWSEPTACKTKPTLYTCCDLISWNAIRYFVLFFNSVADIVELIWCQAVCPSSIFSPLTNVSQGL